MFMLNSLTQLGPFLGSFDVVIFDLDGVILDSGNLKIQCMRETLRDFDTHFVEPFLETFKKKFGQTRQYHFKNFFDNYLKSEDCFESFYAHYATFYANLLKIKYPLVDICQYADTIIKMLADKNLKLYVATGTAEEEAKLVLKTKGLDAYFDGIFGAPLDKAESIKHIIQTNNVARNKAIMMGDAIHDRDSAFANQIPFVFVEQYSFMSREDLSNNFENSFSIVKNLNPLCTVENNRRVNS